MRSKDIVIVKEFQDVFSNEFPRMPPNRKVEFCIDLVLRTSLIFIASYMMASAELKELKVQLQELVDKRFIRLTVSPWGVGLVI